MLGRHRIPVEQAQEAIERAATILAQHPGVRLVYVYGSAADDARATVQAVDLALLPANALTLDELMRLRAELVKVCG